MFKCVECGNLFEEGEQKIFFDPVGESHSSNAWEEVEGCPLCGGDYEKIEPCRICKSYCHEAKSEYCDDCIKSVEDKFVSFVSDLFTKEERKLINMIYDDGRHI